MGVDKCVEEEMRLVVLMLFVYGSMYGQRRCVDVEKMLEKKEREEKRVEEYMKVVYKSVEDDGGFEKNGVELVFKDGGVEFLDDFMVVVDRLGDGFVRDKSGFVWWEHAGVREVMLRAEMFYFPERFDWEYRIVGKREYFWEGVKYTYYDYAWY